MWSDYANGHIYQFVGLILQTAEAYNIIVGGGSKYSVPSGNLTFPSVPATQNLTSYALSAIAGADDLDDDSVTVREAFGTIVDITREITLTCEFPVVRSFYSPVRADRFGDFFNSFLRDAAFRVQSVIPISFPS